MASYGEIARHALAALDAVEAPENLPAGEPAKPAETPAQDPHAEAFGSWAEWKAAMLNQLFAEQGCTGEPGRITAETVRHGERERRPTEAVQVQVAGMPADPRRPGKHIDPATGIWPLAEWGAACRRGFVSNERFGSGPVVPRTNRQSTRKWRQIHAGEAVLRGKGGSS